MRARHLSLGRRHGKWQRSVFWWMHRVRLWWRKIRKLAAATAVLAFLGGGLVLLILAGYRVAWTGFLNKTLWDWLNLLGVLAIPIAVALGTTWFTTQQAKVSERENTDNQREIALQAYIDTMSALLLEKKLRESDKDAEVRKIARVRTLTALTRLDAHRKRSVIQFLYESGLIDRDKPIVDMNGADLSYADLGWHGPNSANWSHINLSGANLQRASLWIAFLDDADLSHANLEEADLNGAVLMGTTLKNTYLIKANLNGAVLKGADLSFAHLGDASLYNADMSNAGLTGVQGITIEELEKKTRSLKGAIMPDGSKHS